MISSNTKEVLLDGMMYMVDCKEVGGNWECRTGSGYLLPIPKKDGTFHEAVTQPDGYTNCVWDNRTWGWEC